MDRTCNEHGRDVKRVQHFGWKPEGKRPFGKTRCRLEDNIRMNRREIEWEGVDWIYLA
jgi:hypothetical protein